MVVEDGDIYNQELVNVLQHINVPYVYLQGKMTYSGEVSSDIKDNLRNGVSCSCQ